MWLKVTAYNDFNTRKIRKLYDYLSKSKYSKEGRKRFVEIWENNIPKDVPLARFWRKKLELRLSKPTRGKKPTRYAYQIVVNPGVKVEYEEDFKKFLRDFLERCFTDKHYFAFIHKDKNCIHSHILIHAVDLNGNMVRITKKEISEIQSIARELEDKHKLREKLRKPTIVKAQAQEKVQSFKDGQHEKVKYEELINESWGIRSIIANSKLFSRKNRKTVTTN